MNTEPANTKPDRYPGIKSFEKGQAALFKGREEEITELFARVKSDHCLLLYSKSGLGKSSLLNAGLSPLLESKGYISISIRSQLTKSHHSLVSVVKKNLQTFAGKIKAESVENQDAETLPLWEYIKTCCFPFGFTPVLIFDQFEEFFSNKREHQDEFLYAIREILHNEVPVRILDWYMKIPVEQRTPAQVAWCTQPQVKIIFAIREDRLGDMGSLSQVIPGILRNRYQLEALSVEKAKQAIEQPAGIESDAYTTEKFIFAPQALTTILNKLSSGKTFVETTQLQIVCNQVENIVKKKQIEHPGERITVVDDFFGGRNGLDDIINNFYDRQIDNLPEEVAKEMAKRPAEARIAPLPGEVSKHCARDLVETRMVHNGKRVLLSEDQVKDFLTESIKENIEEHTGKEEPVPAQPAKADALMNLEIHASYIVTALLNLRLIRGDYREDQRLYEISHDTLLQPINNAVKKRKEEEEQENLKKYKEESERMLQEANEAAREERERASTALALVEKATNAEKEAERMKAIAFKERDEAFKQRRRARRRTRLSYVLFFISVILGIIALVKSQQAKDNLYASLMNTAEKYYNDNNHYMAYELFRETAARSNASSDSASRFLENNFFFDISAGERIDTMANKSFAVQYADKTLVYWETGDGNSPFKYTLVDPYVNTFTWSKQSNLLAYRDRSGRVILWNAGKKNPLPAEVTVSDESSKKEKDNQYDEELIFSKDGWFLLMQDNEDSVRVFDINKGKLLPKSIVPPEFGGSLRGLAVEGNAEKRLLTVGTKEKMLRLWNISNPDRPFQQNETTSDYAVCAVNRNGTVILMNRTLKRLEIFKKSVGSRFEIQSEIVDDVNSFLPSPDGERLFFIGRNGRVCYYSFPEQSIRETAIRIDELRRQLVPTRSNIENQRTGSKTNLLAKVTMNNAGTFLTYTNEGYKRWVQLQNNGRDSFPIRVGDGSVDYIFSKNKTACAWISPEGYIVYKNMVTGNLFTADTLKLNEDSIPDGDVYLNNPGTVLAYEKEMNGEKALILYDVQTRKIISRWPELKLGIGTDRYFTDNYILAFNKKDQEGIVFFRVEQSKNNNKLLPRMNNETMEKFGIRHKRFWIF